MNFEKYSDEELQLTEIAYGFPEIVLVKFLFDENIAEEYTKRIHLLQKENPYFLERIEELKFLFERKKITSSGFYKRYRTLMQVKFNTRMIPKSENKLAKKNNIPQEDKVSDSDRHSQEIENDPLQKLLPEKKQQLGSELGKASDPLYPSEWFSTPEEAEEYIRFQKQKKAFEERVAMVKKMCFDTDFNPSTIENVPAYMRRRTGTERNSHEENNAYKQIEDFLKTPKSSHD